MIVPELELNLVRQGLRWLVKKRSLMSLAPLEEALYTELCRRESALLTLIRELQADVPAR